MKKHHESTSWTDMPPWRACIFAVTLTRVQSDPNQSLQTVRKVLSRLKYPVPLCKARSGFSILTEEYLTFRTISPVIGPQKPNEEPCHAGRALRVNLCLESAVQLISVLIVEFILQNAEVLDFLVLDLALVLSSPLPEERIESPGNISTQNWSCLENERLDIVLC